MIGTGFLGGQYGIVTPRPPGLLSDTAATHGAGGGVWLHPGP